jgi:hypothetical protein
LFLDREEANIMVGGCDGDRLLTSRQLAEDGGERERREREERWFRGQDIALGTPEGPHFN